MSSALARISVLIGLLLVLASGSAAQAGSDTVKQLRELFLEATTPASFGGGQSVSDRPARTRNLTLAGSHSLGDRGFNADVWAHGNAAYVGNWGAFGFACPNQGTAVIDISDPASPSPLSTLAPPAETQTNDVKVASVSTPYFRGDLAVISNEDCDAGGGRGFQLFDVTDPASPVELGRFGPEDAFDTPEFLTDIGFGVHNLFIFENRQRVYVAAVIDFAEIFQLLFDGEATTGDLRLVDVTDPRNPVQVADWGAIKDLGLDPFATGQGDDFALSFLHDVWVERDVAYLSWWDAGLILLDVSDPANPEFISRTPYGPDEEGNTHVAVPARGGNLVVTGDEDFTPGPWGFMRVFDSRDAGDPVQIGTFATENTLSAPPPAGDYSIHNVLTRGNTVYTSWYSDGIRLVDISQPAAPREIAAFVPPARPDPFGLLPTAPEVWGVYPHKNLVLASDMNAGLYILETKP